MSGWEDAEPWFAELESRPLGSAADLERWLLDQSELASALAEEGTRRYVAMTCATDDEAHEAAWLAWVEEMEPRAEPRWHALERRYLEAPARRDLSPFYAVHDRTVANSAALFREENVPLQAEESRLEQRYHKLCGAQEVEFQGRSRTMDEMGLYLEEPDRPLREEAWRLAAGRRLEDAGDLEDLYDRLLEVRGQQARNAGFPSYREYAFRSLERFDYGPEDCLRFHEGVERAVVPLLVEQHESRRRRLGVERLRPWDLQVDPWSRPPLRPFQSTEELVRGVGEMVRRVDAVCGAWFEDLAGRGLLDLESRPGKAPGEYQCFLEEARLPFLFMNAVGRDSDLRGLLHEAGHAFHSNACRHFDLAGYRHAPMEFSEVASTAMELLGGDVLDVFYGPREAARSNLDHLRDVVALLPHVALVDAFQHWVYTHPGHSREERRVAWAAQMERFGGGVDWAGLELQRDTRWHLVLHLYESPFYFVEYGFAALGALDVWQAARRDRAAALEAWRGALALGGSRPLPELFEAAGSRFDFGTLRVRRLLEPVLEEIRRLEEEAGS